jgi:hypothetical protein
MVLTSEPIGNIAGVGAELPAPVPVDSKLFPAGRADEDVDRLPLHQFQVAVPPLIPAGIAAEPFPLPARSLFDGAAALLTYGLCWRFSQTVPPAERFHGVDGKAQLAGYTPIPHPIPAQGNDLSLLFVLHMGHLLKIWFSGVTGQKGYR